MSTVLAQARVDESLKKSAEELFSQFGLDVPTAIRMFLTVSVKQGGLPFELRLNSKSSDDKFQKKDNIPSEQDFRSDPNYRPIPHLDKMRRWKFGVSKNGNAVIPEDYPKWKVEAWGI